MAQEVGDVGLVQRLVWRFAPERHRASFIRNLGLPEGRMGRRVGALLAKSNAGHNTFAVRHLEARPGEVLLEFGHGPGAGVPELLEAVGEAGHVIGVEPSTEMIAATQHHNRDAIAAGRLTLHEGSTRQLPLETGSVDAALGNNVLYFWRDPAVDLAELRRVLRPEGRLGLGFRPRSSTEEELRRRFDRAGHSLYEVDQVEAMLLAAGFATPTFTTDEDGWVFALASLRPVVAAPETAPVDDHEAESHWFVVD